MFSREDLLELAHVLALKAEIKVKRGDTMAGLYFMEIAEGMTLLASDLDHRPLLDLSMPHRNVAALASLSVQLVLRRIGREEYVEAAVALGFDRELAEVRCLSLSNHGEVYAT